MIAARVSCLLLLAAVCSAVVITPKFSWGQNQDELFLTIKAKCAPGTREASVEKDHFTFMCKEAGSDKPVNLEFNLREDATNVKCVSKTNTEICTIVKKESSLFDRLVNSDLEEKMLKEYMSVEWDRYEEEEETQIDYVSDIFARAKGVRRLTDADFESFLDENDVVVLSVAYPWCRTCENAMKEFGKAARKIKKGVAFAYADARTERNIRHKLDVTCSVDAGRCGFWLFKRGEEHRYVKSGDVDETVKFVKPFIGTLVEPVKSKKEVEALRKKHPDGVVLGVFASEKDAGYELFMAAARELRGVVKFVVNMDGKTFDYPGAEVGGIVVFGGPLEAPGTSVKAAAMPEHNLVKLIRSAVLPPIVKYHWERRKYLEDTKLTFVKIFFNATDEAKWAELEPFEKVADAFRGRFQFVYHTREHLEQIKQFGLDDTDTPVVLVSDALSTQDAIPTFVYDKAESLHAFLNNALERKLKPALKTGKPEPAEPGKVRKYVAKTFDEDVFNSETDALIAFMPSYQTTNWLQKDGAAFVETAAILEHVPGIALGTYDTYGNKFPYPEAAPEVTAVPKPVAFFYHKGQPPLKFKGLEKMTTSKLLKFLSASSAAVAAAESTIAEGLKRIDDARAAKAAEEASKRAARDATLAGYPRVDITGNGAVTKHITQAGSGKTPVNGDDIEAHYTGRLIENGQQFDSSVGRGPFTFKLGQGQVISCWDKSFATMAIGEKAILTCAPEHAYGDGGSPPTIPGKATLEFEVELLKINGKGAETKEEL